MKIVGLEWSVGKGEKGMLILVYVDSELIGGVGGQWCIA